MTRYIVLFAAIVAAWTADVPAGELEPLDAPRPPPALELPDLKGDPRALADYGGNVVLVNFWASWCPPCLIEMPGMERLARRLDGRPFVILAVNVGESRAKAYKALGMLGFTQTVLLDAGGATADAWGASVLPTSFLVDPQGRIRYEAVGQLDWDDDEVVAVVEALIAESPLPARTHHAVLGFDHVNR